MSDIFSSAFLKDNSYHFAPFEFLFSKGKKSRKQVLVRIWGSWTRCVTGENVAGTASVENGMLVPKQSHIELPCSLSVPLLDRSPGERKSRNHTDHVYDRTILRT